MKSTALRLPTREDIEEAAKRLSGKILRTPLISLLQSPAPVTATTTPRSGGAQPPKSSSPQIYLKVESLHSVGSFKIRGAGNILLSAIADSQSQLPATVIVPSAGSMALAVCEWIEQLTGSSTQSTTHTPTRVGVIVPETASAAKVKTITERYANARVLRVPFKDWFEVVIKHDASKYYPLLMADDAKAGGGTATATAAVVADTKTASPPPPPPPLFIHPVCSRLVMAGAGTIGLEILNDCPTVDTVLLPYGGGGLTCGVGAALKALKPSVKIIAVEVENAAPLTAALKAGAPVDTVFQPTWIDGIGSPRILDEMWPLVKSVVDGTVVVSVAEVRRALITVFERNHLIVEGAAAATVAAAFKTSELQTRFGSKVVCCVLSGANGMDRHKLTHLVHEEEEEADAAAAKTGTDSGSATAKK